MMGLNVYNEQNDKLGDINEILLDKDGKVLGYLGRSGHLAKQFGWIHEIACPNENTLFVGELLNWRVQKLVVKSSSHRSNN